MSTTSFMAIALAALSVVSISQFPSWRSEIDDLTGDELDIKDFPSQFILQTSVTATCCAATFALIAALWQHTAAVTLASLVESLGLGNVKASVGSASASLVWAGCTLLLVEALWLVRVALRIWILNETLDREELARRCRP